MNARDTLLLSCGTVTSRNALRIIFEDNFNILEADSTSQTVMFLKQNHHCIAAVLLDITSLENVDDSFFEQIKENTISNDIPFIVIVPEHAPDLMYLAFEQGAADVILSISPVLQQRVEKTINLYRHKWTLEKQVEEHTELLRKSNQSVTDLLSSIIEHRSVESGQHVLRIRHFTRILLEEVSKTCPEYKLTPYMIELISSAAALHDIGKISIPDAILNKPGKLSEEEWAIMKTHTLSGCEILENMRSALDPEYMRYAYHICRHHHERWDGSGYPDGLSGENIPICAQTVGMADAYEALTSKRIYKNAYSFDRAANMILNEDCGQFSPKLLECFKQVLPKFNSLAQQYADGLSPHTENFNVSLPIPEFDDALNSLENVQHKLQTMIHFANGTVIELDLKQRIFHSLYNPYPELSMLSDCSTFDAAIKNTYRILLPEERPKFRELLTKELPHFLDNDIRKLTYIFRTYGSTSEKESTFQVSLLRIDFNPSSQKFLFICQKQAASSIALTDLPAPPSLFDIDPAYQQLASFFCIHNDKYFTLQGTASKMINISGYSGIEFQMYFKNQLIKVILPEDRTMVLQETHQQLACGATTEITCRIRHKNGHTIPVLIKSRLVLGTDGSEYLYCMMTNLSDTQKSSNELKLSAAQYQKLLEQTDNIIFEWNSKGDSFTVSKQWNTIFGYTPKNLGLMADLSVYSHLHPEDVGIVTNCFHNFQSGVSYQTGELRIANADGRYLWCQLQAIASYDENNVLQKITGFLKNIDQEKRTTVLLQNRAERDSLTKLLNQNTAHRQAEEYLLSYPQGVRCALLIIDLDNFKQINDQYGHRFGDTVLIQVSKEIKKLFHSQDIIARIGGDEFMVFMRGISDRKIVKNRCSRLIFALHNLFRHHFRDCPLSCSIGIALAPEHGNTYKELFQHADQALYQTKSYGKDGFHFYLSETDE